LLGQAQQILIGAAMTHTVRDWMSNPVIVIDADSSVSYALTLMRRRHIHSLIVDTGMPATPYGIITTTDIRDKIIGQERNPGQVTVSEIMSVQLITASPEWTLKDCSIKMQKHNIHHLPVIENGGLVGIISDTDLFYAAEEIGWEQDD
jgi:CBS domain-containing protein